MRATLILENGAMFQGTGMGDPADRICEMVFNTSMAGYQEVLTDPSYAGQGVVMTYPLIGNYGVNKEDEESSHPWAEAFVVRRLCRRGSNFRCEGDLDSYLKENHVAGLCYHVALMDFGVKQNMIRSLVKRGCRVTVLPAHTPAAEILAGGYDGVMLSNGPGDPADCTEIIAELKKLYESDLPIFGVCLGHQLMALATGAKSEKLKYGHRGGNHPVRDIAEGRVYITSQNHGYCIVADSVDPAVAEVSHVNVNDGTVEGLRYKNRKLFTVQFHPEAAPGPQDTAYLFDRFIAMMGGDR